MNAEAKIAASSPSSVIEALQDLRLGVQADIHCLDDGVEKLAALDFAIVAVANLSTLFEHAKGVVNHAFAGQCPDLSEGLDVRDPDCPVCQALINITNAQAGLPVALAPAPTIPPVIREALEATFEQKPGHLKLVSAAVRELGTNS